MFCRLIKILALLLLCLSLLGEQYLLADVPEGLSPQTLKAPNGPTALKGLGESFSPDIATGSGGYSIPISTPPGFLQPAVVLQYSPGNGKTDIGLGFKLSTSFIFRTTDKGLPEFTNDDRFAVSGSSLNDELVLVDAKKRWYRLKNEGTFALFIHNADDNSWKVRLPNGQTLYFGSSSNSRQSNSYGTYRWYLHKHEDRFTHSTEYEYTEDKNHFYLSEIVYQLHALEEYQNRIIFNYESRPDVFNDYTYGEAETCRHRLERIDVLHGSRRLRHYELGYIEEELFSLLHTVTMSGENNLKMPTLTLEYVEHSNAGYFVEMNSVNHLEILVNGTGTLEDVNADGLPDILIGHSLDYKYYENIDGQSWSDSAYNLSRSPDRNLTDEGVLLLDANGDGFRDVLYPHDGKFRYYPGGNIRNGRFIGFDESVELYTSVDLHINWKSPNVKVGDLNRDGRIDLFHQKTNSVAAVINHKDNILEEIQVQQLPMDVILSDPRFSYQDFNGDGLQDFVYKYITWDDSKVRVWFGKGWGEFTEFEEMYNVPNGNDADFYLQDVNRDGQADLVRISSSQVSYYLNNGTNAFTNSKGDFPSAPPIYETQKILFADMNGNGSNDAVWITKDNKIKYLDFTVSPEFGLLSRVDNGMGSVTEIKYRPSTEYMIEAKKRGEPWKTTMPHPIPVVSEYSVSDSFDKIGFDENIIVVQYDYRDGYYEGKESEFRGFGEATSRKLGDEWRPDEIVRSYFHVGKNFETGVDEEILKGKIYLKLNEDEDGNIYNSVETEYKYGFMCQNQLDASYPDILPNCSMYGDPNDYEGLVEHKDELVSFAKSKGVLTGVWEGTDNPKWTFTEPTYDAWGNVVASEQFGEVRMQPRQPGDYFDIGMMNTEVGNNEVFTEADFIYNVNEWLLALPYASRTYADGELQAQARKYYDDLSAGNVINGLVTSESVWLKSEHEETERWITTTHNKYDKHGNISEVRDAKNNLRRFEYDIQTNNFLVDEFVQVEIGELQYSAEVDRGLGAITSVTDYNGHTSSFGYDGLGRLTTIVGPLDSFAKPLMRFSYEYGDPFSTTITEALIDRATGATAKSWSFTDGLGKTRLSIQQAEDPHRLVASGWKDYTSLGQDARVYRGYTVTSPTLQQPPSGTPSTRTYYDLMGRPIKVYPPKVEDGASKASGAFIEQRYYPFETHVFNEKDVAEGNYKYPEISRTDGLGRVVEVIKHNDIDGKFTELSWKFNYDAFGKILGFSDPLGKDVNKREYTYDSLSRMTSLTVPGVGSMRFEYDDLGNNVLQVDAINNRIITEYGKANRIVSNRAVSEDGRHDTSYYYNYDEAGNTDSNARNLLGRVSYIDGPISSAAFSYNEMGQVERQVRELWDPRISGFDNQIRTRFERTNKYNALNAITDDYLPGGVHFNIAYNIRGLVDNIGGSIGERDLSFVTNIRYDDMGLVKQQDLGNGLSDCFWHDGRDRTVGLMTAPTTANVCSNKDTENPDAIRHFDYDLSLDNMLLAVRDKTHNSIIPDQTAFYTYDHLNQLVEAETPRGRLSYDYDRIQNITSRSSDFEDNRLIFGQFKYENEGAPNQLTKAGNRTFEYDEAGYMKEYNGFTLDFDAYGRLSAADGEDTIINYYYDFSGERRLMVKQRGGEKPSVTSFPFEGYQIRDEAEVWTLQAGGKVAEITRSKPRRPDLEMLDKIIDYWLNQGSVPPVADMKMIDYNGDGTFNLLDVDLAIEIFMSGAEYDTSRSAGAGFPPWSSKYSWQDDLEPVITTLFYHSDYQGGPQLLTTERGELASHTGFFPYGEKRDQLGQMSVSGFAGSIRDDSPLGLIRFGARWYSPLIGRWASADPLFVMEPGKVRAGVLQANLYMYAGGNPISFVDLLGFDLTEAQYQELEKEYGWSRPLARAMTGNHEDGLTDAEKQQFYRRTAITLLAVGFCLTGPGAAAFGGEIEVAWLTATTAKAWTIEGILSAFTAGGATSVVVYDLSLLYKCSQGDEISSYDALKGAVTAFATAGTGSVFGFGGPSYDKDSNIKKFGKAGYDFLVGASIAYGLQSATKNENEEYDWKVIITAGFINMATGVIIDRVDMGSEFSQATLQSVILSSGIENIDDITEFMQNIVNGIVETGGNNEEGEK